MDTTHMPRELATLCDLQGGDSIEVVQQGGIVSAPLVYCGNSERWLYAFDENDATPFAFPLCNVLFVVIVRGDDD